MSTQIKNQRGSILTVFLVVFIDLLGFGIVIPILPYYSKSFGASGFELGLLMASFSLMQFFFAPFWGRLSDRVGRKPILLFTIAGTSLALLWMGLADSFATLFAARILAGFFGGNLSTAYALMADLTPEEDRAKGMGLIGAAFGLGFIFGPAIGGVLSVYGYSAPMFLGAGLSVFNLILAFFILKEPSTTLQIREKNRTKRFDFLVIRETFQNKAAWKWIVLFFFTTVALTQMEVVFALFLAERFGLDAKHAGALLAVTGIVMVILQGTQIGKLSKRFGEVKLLRAGMIFVITGLILFANSWNYYLLGFSLLLLSIGQGLLSPCLSSLVSKASPADKRGATMGVYQSAGSAARVVGPVIAGKSFDSLAHTAPFYFGAVLLVYGLISLVSRPGTKS